MSNGSKRPFARTTASPRLSRALTPIAPPSATAVLACDNGRVHFRWKDYRANGKSKVMTLDADEFIRRFLLHTLPKGFRRIRHFGFPANTFRAAKLARIRTALDAPEPAPAAEQSRALRDPHWSSHRSVPGLRRPHGRDQSLAVRSIVATAVTTGVTRHDASRSRSQFIVLPLVAPMLSDRSDEPRP
jgi:hypothetical protein